MTALPGRTLAGILALALAARLAVLPFTLPRYTWGRHYPDTAQYEAAAANLLDGKGLVVSGREIAARPPLYPVFLAAFRAALGDGRTFALGVILAQCALMSAACALTADLGGRLFGAAPGRLAGWAASLHPELVLYPSLLLSETLAVALVVAALWAAAFARVARRPCLWAAAAGACCGAAALTRASLLPLAGLLALWLAAALRSPRSAAICLAAAAAVVLPWTARNRARLGAWVPVTTKLGHDLYEQFNPRATGGPGFDVVWPHLPGLGEVERDRELRQRALAWARENPRRVVILTLERIRRFLNPLPNDPEHRTAAVMGVALLANLPLLALSALSMGRVLRPDPRAWILAAIPFLLLLAVHAVFTGSVRYRAPAIPGLAILAAAAVRRPRA